MARAGDRFVMPEGSEYLVVASHDETGGEYVEMEWLLQPGSFAPPTHVHPTQSEDYEVLEGSLDVNVGGEWRTLSEGESASVPPGVDHTFRVPGDGRVKVRNFHRPGGHFDRFIEQQHRFVSSDRFKGMKHPSTAVAMSTAWRDHEDLLVPSNPVLRWTMAALAPIGRRRGYGLDRTASP
jgi:mannose-6-phosphate isomerase-like protein (cupin superfamily)